MNKKELKEQLADLNKEITSIKADIYKQYERLQKVRFCLSGIEVELEDSDSDEF